MARQYGVDPNDPNSKPNTQSNVLTYYELGKAPTSQEVAFLHKNSDVDSRAEAQHHTLGVGSGQAAPGDHNHRDGRSLPILEGITINGSTSGTNQVVLKSIIAALKAIGATDGST